MNGSPYCAVSASSIRAGSVDLQKPVYTVCYSIVLFIDLSASTHAFEFSLCSAKKPSLFTQMSVRVPR